MLKQLEKPRPISSITMLVLLAGAMYVPMRAEANVSGQSVLSVNFIAYDSQSYFSASSNSSTEIYVQAETGYYSPPLDGLSSPTLTSWYWYHWFKTDVLNGHGWYAATDFSQITAWATSGQSLNAVAFYTDGYANTPNPISDGNLHISRSFAEVGFNKISYAIAPYGGVEIRANSSANATGDGILTEVPNGSIREFYYASTYISRNDPLGQLTTDSSFSFGLTTLGSFSGTKESVTSLVIHNPSNDWLFGQVDVKMHSTASSNAGGIFSPVPEGSSLGMFAAGLLVLAISIRPMALKRVRLG